MRIPVFEVTGLQLDALKLTNKRTQKSKIFKIGSKGWRLLYFTQFRANAEHCSPTSREIPWDVQQDVAYTVWKMKQ